MKLYTIIIASNDHNYNVILADRLRRYYQHSTRLEIFAVSSELEAMNSNFDSSQPQRRALLFLGTAIDGCTRSCGNCRSNHHCLACFYLNRADIDMGSSFYYFCSGNQKPDRITDDNTLIKWPTTVSHILNLLQANMDSEQASSAEKPEMLSEQQMSNEGTMCMHLLLSDNVGRSLQDLMRAQIRQGKKVYYLAIMPSWNMHLCCTPDSTGPDLSSLLLAIHQHCPPEAEKIGIFTQLHPDGYFQFRPPARGDDLISCEPEHLRKLLLLIRQKVKCDDQDTYCWVDCRDISIQTAGRGAALCDHLLLDLSTGEDFAAASARREAGLMLASLPNSCNIYESRQQLEERLKI